MLPLGSTLSSDDITTIYKTLLYILLILLINAFSSTSSAYTPYNNLDILGLNYGDVID
jgi:hypothetical protein